MESAKQNKRFRFNFAVENDILTLKVLCQILYEELDNLIYNYVLRQPTRLENLAKEANEAKELQGDFISLKRGI